MDSPAAARFHGHITPWRSRHDSASRSRCSPRLESRSRLRPPTRRRLSTVEGQPLAANAARLVKALDFLGAPLDAETGKALTKAIEAKDAKAIQQVLDKHVLFVVNINPESRVKVARGPGGGEAPAGRLDAGAREGREREHGEEAARRSPARSPGRRYSGPAAERNPKDDPKIVDRFLELEMFTAPPMTADLSGLQRRIRHRPDLLVRGGQARGDDRLRRRPGEPGSRLPRRGAGAVRRAAGDPGEAERQRLRRQADRRPVHVHGRGRARLSAAAEAARPGLLLPEADLPADGGIVLLPPGEFTVEYGRGPEYRVKSAEAQVVWSRTGKGKPQTRRCKLERWINPADFGWYSGDHHIHAAGCAHYTNPTEGVLPEDMFLHVKGEGLNVGCCLTWGPCYDYQRKFFEASPHRLTEPFTVLKYDVEVSGFGSQALGHVCLLNLRDQTYPGSDGTKVKGWPTWTTPLMKWAKDQGAVTGYAHSANGLGLEPAGRDASGCSRASTRTATAASAQDEAKAGKWPLPEPFATIDADSDGKLTADELLQEHAASRRRSCRTSSSPRWTASGPRRSASRPRWACATSSARWTRSGRRSGTAGTTS